MTQNLQDVDRLLQTFSLAFNIGFSANYALVKHPHVHRKATFNYVKEITSRTLSTKITT
jgi:hypothetical protein